MAKEIKAKTTAREIIVAKKPSAEKKVSVKKVAKPLKVEKRVLTAHGKKSLALKKKT
jgi:hypothetical protein